MTVTWWRYWSVPEEHPAAQCCEHAEEIARLRGELAELRAEVERLAQAVTATGQPAPVVSHTLTSGRWAEPRSHDEPSAPAPLMFGSEGLPYADQDSPRAAKIALYRALFVGRQDVYAYRWDNAATGEGGWAPRRVPGSRKEDAQFLPLTDEVIEAHLTDGPLTAGLYVMLPDSTSRLLACDFDGPAWRLDAVAYVQAAQAAGVPAALEVSRSGEGGHAWIFFSEPVAAADARALGAALLREAMAMRGELGLESYDRFFPAQDFMPKKGLGNLIALPLQGRCRKRGGTTVFVDPQTLDPLGDQFAFLSSIRRLGSAEVVDKVEELQPPVVGPATRLYRAPLAAEPPAPEVVKAELAGMLAVRWAGLPPSLLASLKHLASLHNVEFYEKQRMGFSVWKTPRFLRCYEETLEHLYLPRGVQDQAQSIIEEAGSRLEIRDARSAPARMDLTFGATLRDETQQNAVEMMARHELGVLVAPPGAGKTVMACALIARHSTPALVLVDRAPLLRQWQERLRTCLGLSAGQIGQIGGGKSRRTGVVDLAMLQTVTRHDDPAALLDGYGLVVVDECHHVAADTFEDAIKNIAARRWLGLTATPKRADHREQIMLMHCGPVRHRIAAGNDLCKSLIIHPTSFTIRDDIDSDVPGLLSSVILPALAADDERTRQVCCDVAQAARRGRNCLVLTGRTSHVGVLVDGLRSQGLTPLALYGSLKPRERLSVLDRLSTTPDGGPPLLVVATDRYIGEGFDCPRLDALFLTFPVSSESPITQYVGRILRDHPGKPGVEVHDYADTKVPMLARMHGKRLTSYRRLGFTVPSAVPAPPTLDSLITPSAPAASDDEPSQAETVPATAATEVPGRVLVATPTASQVRAWARGQGLEVPVRGRLSSEIWSAYQREHTHAG